jgi:hypothetical protein
MQQMDIVSGVQLLVFESIHLFTPAPTLLDTRRIAWNSAVPAPQELRANYAMKSTFPSCSSC